MLLAYQRAEMLSGSLGLAVGRAGLGQERAAWPVFLDGGEICGLGTVDGAGAGEQKTAGACGDRQIEDVSSAIHDLVVALQRREPGANGGVCGGVQHMGEGLVPGQRVALLNVAPQKRD